MESGHVAGPMGEAGGAEMKAAAQAAGEPIPGAGAIAAPMEGVALGAGPTVRAKMTGRSANSRETSKMAFW